MTPRRCRLLILGSTGFNSATAWSPWMTTNLFSSLIPWNELQFGHGVVAVDDPLSFDRRKRARLGFNSATAWSPWMTIFTVDAPTKANTLQFGHGVVAVDDCRSARPPCPGRTGFNSATAWSPWMTQATGAKR